MMGHVMLGDKTFLLQLSSFLPQRNKRDYPGQNLSTFSWSPPFTPLLNNGSRWKINNFYYSFRLEAASLKAGVQGAYKEVPSFVPCWDDEPSTYWDNESSTS